MTNHRDAGSMEKVMPVAAVEFGESLVKLRGINETGLKHADSVPPAGHDLEDSFGSWNEMDKVD